MCARRAREAVRGRARSPRPRGRPEPAERRPAPRGGGRRAASENPSSSGRGARAAPRSGASRLPCEHRLVSTATPGILVERKRGQEGKPRPGTGQKESG